MVRADTEVLDRVNVFLWEKAPMELLSVLLSAGEGLVTYLALMGNYLPAKAAGNVCITEQEEQEVKLLY